MSGNKGKRSQASLCGKSMQIVVNIMKVSSLSLAKFTLTPRTGSVPSGGFLANPDHTNNVNESRKKLQEPENERKNPSYLMEPDEGINAMKVMEDVNEVDLKASSYINKVYERNRSASKGSRLKDSSIFIPPPPVWK